MINLYRKARQLISPYYRYLEMRCKIVWYNLHRNGIVKFVREKDRIRVAFFVVNLSMWKCDSLFRKMLSDSRFDPVIVPMPRPMLNQESEWQEQMRLIRFCRQNSYPYIAGYDYETERFNGFNEIRPYVVFFSQPYNGAFPAHRIEKSWKHCLFYYVPYCILVEKINSFIDTLYMNICQTVFVENRILKDVESRVISTRGRNMVVSGYMGAESLRNGSAADASVWKQPDSAIKKVIWAPHHSIRDIDVLNYSAFLDIADEMLELARSYQGKLQFAFKPHPGLKPKLYDMDGWGRERTDRYYSQWEQMSNTVLAEGSYDSLFRSSDAMVHDCSSFTVEYLYTEKPVMFITKDDHLDFMNSLGAQCYDVHYKGRTIDDIRSFLDNVVLNGNDVIKGERQRFVSENLMQPDALPAADFIFNSIKEQLVRKRDKCL